MYIKFSKMDGGTNMYDDQARMYDLLARALIEANRATDTYEGIHWHIIRPSRNVLVQQIQTNTTTTSFPGTRGFR